MPSLHSIRKLKAGAAAVRQQLGSNPGVKGFADRSALLSWHPEGGTPAAFLASLSPFRVSAASGGAKPIPEVSSVSKTALSISEAFARVFATPSAHGTVWPACGYQQVGRSDLLDKGSGPGPRLHAELSLDAARDGGFGVSRVKGTGVSLLQCAFGNEVVWRRNGWFGREDLELDFRYRFGDGMTVCSSQAGGSSQEEDEPLGRGSDFRIRSGSSHGDRKSGDGLFGGGASSFQHMLRTSAAYHFFRLAPAADGVFVRCLQDATSGAELAAAPGMGMDGNHDDGNQDSSPPQEPTSVDANNLRLFSGACCLPHPEKMKTGGEDAYFICSDAPVVGVADGVGGWADVGVDAGEYARELMKQATIAVGQEPHGYVDPARVMATAHSRTKCRGSSTACILALSNEGLQAANLGDSGFVVVRNGRTIFKSPPQQHQFNIPFQLESGGSDPPSAAEEFSVPVAAGDVIVAGTDGVFDNLYDTELTSVVMQSTRGGADPQVTAQRIAALARDRAQDRNRQTPFSAAAQDAGIRFYGGKMDDITVVVSYVSTKKSTDNPGKGFLFSTQPKTAS